MSIALFDGTMGAEDRIKAVIRLMDRHPDDIQSDVIRHWIGELLSKSEHVAYEYLKNEVSEAMRGEAAARILKKRKQQPWAIMYDFDTKQLD